MVHQATPSLFGHCETIYARMLNESEEEIADEAGHKVTTWTGATTKMFESEGLSLPYYSRVMNKLQAMGCVTQAARGGGGAPSKWILHTEPTLEVFETARDKPVGKASPKDADTQWRTDMTRAYNQLSNRLAVVEEQLRMLTEIAEEPDDD